MNLDNIEYFANLYEVIFMAPHGGGYQVPEYYRVERITTAGYISVVVPIGDDYEVLLLAGYGQTLLSAGYRGVKDGGTEDDPDLGTVDILPGIVNMVSIALERVAPQWFVYTYPDVVNGSTDHHHKWSSINELNDFTLGHAGSGV
jgi:hypothetical protein